MKSLFAAILFFTLSAAADTANHGNTTNHAVKVACQSNILKVNVTQDAGVLYAEVSQVDATGGQWLTLFAAPVKQSTTRGTNLLFLGENLSISVILETALPNGSLPGTVRLWGRQAVNEQVACTVLL
jgi:hypothetical protein